MYLASILGPWTPSTRTNFVRRRLSDNVAIVGYAYELNYWEACIAGGQWYRCNSKEHAISSVEELARDQGYSFVNSKLESML